MTSSNADSADQRFAAINPTVSAPSAPEAKIQAVRRGGDVLYLSGQVAFRGAELVAVGRLGDEIDVATGVECARQCALNLLARIQEELGSLDKVAQVLKLTVFVASAPGFREQPQVAHGASDAFFEVLGDAGRHARSAVGVAELPLGTPVEAEAIVQVR